MGGEIQNVKYYTNMSDQLVNKFKESSNFGTSTPTQLRNRF